MPSKNPIGKIKDVAAGAAVTVVGTVTETVKDPVGAGQKAVGAGQKVVGTAVGTGQKVVGSAVGQAAAVAGLVGTRVPKRGRGAAPEASSAPVAEPQTEPHKTHGDPVEPAVKKATAKKATAEKTAAKKTAAKKAPAKKAPVPKPPAKTAAELASVDDSSVETPVGTTGADPAVNPDTTESDLQQVGTEPLLDPSLTKAIKSEAEIGARAADVEKD